MKFSVRTLIDITETKARIGEEIIRVNQQQNFLTLLQTLGLRVNLVVEEPPTVKKIHLKGQGFGTRFRGNHRVWTFNFNVEYADTLNVDILQNDFDLVPIISKLSETVKLPHSVFRTKCDKDTNIIFEQINIE